MGASRNDRLPPRCSCEPKGPHYSKSRLPPRCDRMRRALLDATPDFPAAAVVQRHVPVVVDFHDEVHFDAR